MDSAEAAGMDWAQFDNDGDGYCSVDSGGDDCNDDSAAINPGANENTRGKWRNIDRNCNGSFEK